MKDLQSIAKPCQLEMELAHPGTAMELIADEQLLTVQLSLDGDKLVLDRQVGQVR